MSGRVARHFFHAADGSSRTAAHVAERIRRIEDPRDAALPGVTVSSLRSKRDR
jgi:hypothetical protein